MGLIALTRAVFQCLSGDIITSIALKKVSDYMMKVTSVFYLDYRVALALILSTGLTVIIMAVLRSRIRKQPINWNDLGVRLVFILIGSVIGVAIAVFIALQSRS